MEAEIWKYESIKHKPVLYKAYTEDYEQIRKLRRMKDVERHCTYRNKFDREYYAEDFVFPASRYSAVARALDLPEKMKSAGRVRVGRCTNNLGQ